MGRRRPNRCTTFYVDGAGAVRLLNQALRQAGLAIRRDQPGRRAGPTARRAAVQRYLDGESSTSIAADLGCHPATVLKWVRAAAAKTRPHGRPSRGAGS